MSALDESDEVLIIGAGIGGLTLARALTTEGLRCAIFERAPDLSTAGAGIMLQTAAMLALRRIGLDAPVAAAGAELQVGWSATDRGRPLGRSSFTFLKEQLGVPTVALHRARLQRVLREAAPEVPLHFGRTLTGFEGDASGVTATFGDGTRARGALLVGADGLRSVVRRQLLGEQPLRYAGYTSWRGIARSDQPSAQHAVAELWGSGARFGFAGIGPGETYWFAVLDAPPGEKDDHPLDTVKGHFGHFPAPVSALLAATPPDRVLRTDIHDRPPVPTWTSGRVTLLGDAAHPTTPDLGQGGCMAIEDAVVLAYALARAPSFTDAFTCYEKERVPRTTAIVEASRRFGQVAQLRNPVAVWLRDSLLRLTPQRTIRKQLLKTASFALPTIPSARVPAPSQ
jgi:2-polyprenyl-6-methoxyphenol hydroxylase-like FAD-dependent oxidoreductase